MTNGLYDLRSLGTSIEGAGTMMYLVNGSIKGIDGYVKRLIDEIRSTLKKNELKASRTKVVLLWTLDSYEMRGDKVEMLNSLLQNYVIILVMLKYIKDQNLIYFIVIRQQLL